MAVDRADKDKTEVLALNVEQSPERRAPFLPLGGLLELDRNGSGCCAAACVAMTQNSTAGATRRSCLDPVPACLCAGLRSPCAALALTWRLGRSTPPTYATDASRPELTWVLLKSTRSVSLRNLKRNGLAAPERRADHSDRRVPR